MVQAAVHQKIDRQSIAEKREGGREGERERVRRGDRRKGTNRETMRIKAWDNMERHGPAPFKSAGLLLQTGHFHF